MPKFAAEMSARAEAIFQREEFHPYASFKDSILKRLVDRRAEIEGKVASAKQELATVEVSQNAYKKARWTIYLLLGLLFLLIASAAFVSYYLVTVGSEVLAQRLDVDPSSGWFVQNQDSVALTLIAVVVAGSGTMTFFTLSIVRRSRSIKLDERIAQDGYDRELDLAIQEALARSINDELGPKGIVAFPTHAPRLVELDTSRVAPSTTVRYVKDFIVGHESSAIGLAGMRGSGKSTVMRALKTDAELSRFIALIPSPVKYDPGEFIRRLLSDIAHAIAGTDTGWTIGTHRWISRTTVTRFTFFAIIGITGLLLALLRAFDLTVNAVQIDLLLGLGLGLVLIALTGALYSFLNKIAGPGELGLSPDKKRARQVLQMLKWEVERGLSTKSTFKLQSLVESADEDSLKMKSRTLGHSDLVLELQTLLKLFTNTNPEQRFVVCIDELDKLDRPKHLVSVVNELKDLFHIQGIHFVVAVSTDALDSFEKRGLPSRDAFDSSIRCNRLHQLTHPRRVTCCD